MVGVLINSASATEIARAAPTTAAPNATAAAVPKSASGVHARHLPGLSLNSSSHIRHVKSHDLDSGLTPSITPGDSAFSPVLATPEYAKRTSSCAVSPTMSLCGIKSGGSPSSGSDKRKFSGSPLAEGKFKLSQSAASGANDVVPTCVTGTTNGLAPLAESSRSNIDITDTLIADEPPEIQEQRPRKSKQFSFLSYLFCCTGEVTEGKVLPNGQQLISSAAPPVVNVEPSAPVADRNHFTLPPKSRIANRNALAAAPCRTSEVEAPVETGRRGAFFAALKRLLPRSWRFPRVPNKDASSLRSPDQDTQQRRDSGRPQLSRSAAPIAAAPAFGLSNTVRKNFLSSREANPPRASLDRRVDRRPSVGISSHARRRSSRGSAGSRDPTANVIASVAPGVTVAQNAGRSASTLLSHIYGNRNVGNVLLKPIDPADYGKKCLVLDLDETLVHSSFKLIPQADFVVPVEIEQMVHNVYVIKRPGVDEFLRRMGDLFEIVVFTASLAKYADPVIDMLDRHKVVKHRLFRESCYNHKGNYVKDLSQLGRDLRSVIIIDNSPASYLFHPSNAVPISSWFNDLLDSELLELVPFLDDLTRVENVTVVLDQGNE